MIKMLAQERAKKLYRVSSALEENTQQIKVPCRQWEVVAIDAPAAVRRVLANLKLSTDGPLFKPGEYLDTVERLGVLEVK